MPSVAVVAHTQRLKVRTSNVANLTPPYLPVWMHTSEDVLNLIKAARSTRGPAELHASECNFDTVGAKPTHVIARDLYLLLFRL